MKYSVKKFKKHQLKEIKKQETELTKLAKRVQDELNINFFKLETEAEITMIVRRLVRKDLGDCKNIYFQKDIPKRLKSKIVRAISCEVSYQYKTQYKPLIERYFSYRFSLEHMIMKYL